MSELGRLTSKTSYFKPVTFDDVGEADAFVQQNNQNFIEYLASEVFSRFIKKSPYILLAIHLAGFSANLRTRKSRLMSSLYKDRGASIFYHSRLWGVFSKFKNCNRIWRLHINCRAFTCNRPRIYNQLRICNQLGTKKFENSNIFKIRTSFGISNIFLAWILQKGKQKLFKIYKWKKEVEKTFQFGFYFALETFDAIMSCLDVLFLFYCLFFYCL